MQLAHPAPDCLELILSGTWRLAAAPPSLEPLRQQLASGRPTSISFDCRQVRNWDSTLPTFLLAAHALCAGHGLTPDQDGLPAGVRRLLTLALASPEQPLANRADRPTLLARLGEQTLAWVAGGREALTFIGATVLALVSLFRGRARFRGADLLQLLHDCGSQALPIIALVSVLVGLILAFVGAVQLRLFGAEIYVADLVGIGMTREMGAMMAAIVMAGRTGAAFAAQLGTMRVNEEVDALETLGIAPMEFLVLPRMLALVAMMPLLCLYADFMGMLGGLLVGTTLLDLPLRQYLNQSLGAITLNHFLLGVAKSVIFGVLVAMAGCLRGLQCGRSAQAVGQVATSAVVTSIVAIIVADGIFAVVAHLLDI
ncbi:MAG: MlaE family lipid ABC transporter permease subunit [Thermodesulfobacteriota bacterium]